MSMEMQVRFTMDAEAVEREKSVDPTSELDESALAIRFDSKIEILTSNSALEIPSVPLLGFCYGLLDEMIKVMKDPSAEGFYHDFYGEFNISMAIEGGCFVFTLDPDSRSIRCLIGDAVEAFVSFGKSVKEFILAIDPGLVNLPIYDKLIEEIQFHYSMSGHRRKRDL